MGAALLSMGLAVLVPLFHFHADPDRHPECSICLVRSMVSLPVSAPILAPVLSYVSTIRLFNPQPSTHSFTASVPARAPPSVLHR